MLPIKKSQDPEVSSNYRESCLNSERQAFNLFQPNKCLGTLSNKKNDIIWEFFPNVGRLYCKRPEGEASQEEKLCSWTGSPAPSSQWLPESTENQATCRATWSAQKALLVFYEIN